VSGKEGGRDALSMVFANFCLVLGPTSRVSMSTLISLMATRLRIGCLCSASHTSPLPPWPINSSRDCKARLSPVNHGRYPQSEGRTPDT
jgi:hypothetical protein